MAVITTADELPVRPDDVFLAAQSLSRSYGPIAALSGVSVDFLRGEVHAIVGENGAGKSTLMRLLAGEERQDAGRVLIEGTPVRMDSPQEARAHGIAIVHQQFQLVDTMTVAENIFLGAPPVRSAARALSPWWTTGGCTGKPRRGWLASVFPAGRQPGSKISRLRNASLSRSRAQWTARQDC